MTAAEWGGRNHVSSNFARPGEIVHINAHTRRAYAGDVQRFVRSVQKPLGWVTLADVQAFAASLDGTGFGPVDPPVPTGAVTPFEPLSRNKAEWVFSWSDWKWDPAQILFAGLAPGLTGIYQIDLRMPATRTSQVLCIHPPVSYPGGSWRWFIPIPMTSAGS